MFFLELYFSSEEEIGSTRRSSVSSEQLHERAKMVKRVVINIITSPKLIIFLISRIKTVRRCCIHNLFYVILLFFSWNVMHFFGMCSETKINLFCYLRIGHWFSWWIWNILLKGSLSNNPLTLTTKLSIAKLYFYGTLFCW